MNDTFAIFYKMEEEKYIYIITDISKKCISKMKNLI